MRVSLCLLLLAGLLILPASPGHPPQLEVEAAGSGANTDFSSHSDHTVISATFPDESQAVVWTPAALGLLQDILARVEEICRLLEITQHLLEASLRQGTDVRRRKRDVATVWERRAALPWGEEVEEEPEPDPEPNRAPSIAKHWNSWNSWNSWNNQINMETLVWAELLNNGFHTTTPHFEAVKFAEGPTYNGTMNWMGRQFRTVEWEPRSWGRKRGSGKGRPRGKGKEKRRGRVRGQGRRRGRKQERRNRGTSRGTSRGIGRVWNPTWEQEFDHSGDDYREDVRDYHDWGANWDADWEQDWEEDWEEDYDQDWDQDWEENWDDDMDWIKEPVGLLCLSHGYGEHLVPYYNELAVAAAERGFLVFGHDHTGHGHSEGERVQVGKMAEYTGPLLRHCRQVRIRHPRLPLYILGHGLGGLLALLVEADQPGLVSGLVLANPLLKFSPQTTLLVGQFELELVSMFAPRLRLPGTWGEAGLQAITPDRGWRTVLQQDNRVESGDMKALHTRVVASAMRDLANRYKKVDVPYLLIMSDEDNLTDPAAARQFHAEAASEDKQLVSLAAAGHNLFLEREQEVSRQAVSLSLDWLERRVWDEVDSQSYLP